MIVTTRPLQDKAETGEEMKRLIEQYSADLDTIYVMRRGNLMPVAKMSLNEFFDFVRKIPYRIDTKPREVVARPALLIKDRYLGLDCKKKSILMASYVSRNPALQKQKARWRLIASSRRPDGKIHHVFPQLSINGSGWKNIDATYNNYRIFEPKDYITKAEVL